MHYQLFLPDVAAPDPQHLVHAGCGDLVEGALWMQIPAGPADRPGMLVGWARTGAPRLEWKPAAQTWLPALPRRGLPAARYHVGLWNDAPPTPDDLRRPYPHRGGEHELGGQVWLVPKEIELPRECTFADDGSWKFDRLRRFADFGAAVDCLRQRWLAEMRAAPEQPAERPVLRTEVLDLLLDALRLNYRLLDELVPPLRLFRTDSLIGPFETILGL